MTLIGLSNSFTQKKCFELLPQVNITSKAIARAQIYGIANGLDDCPTEKITDLAASALKLLEAIHNNGLGGAKVRTFINAKGLDITDKLNDTCQKIEWLIRIFKLSGNLEWIQLADKILLDKEQRLSCPSIFFTELAHLFAMNGVGHKAIYWLEQGLKDKSPYEAAKDYQSIAAVFFDEGLFKQGLALYKRTSNLEKIEDQTQPNFSQFLADALNQKEKLDNPDYRQILENLAIKENKQNTLINAYCYIDKIDWAFDFAKKLTLENNKISYLLQLLSYVKKNNSSLPKLINATSNNSALVSFLPEENHADCTKKLVGLIDQTPIPEKSLIQLIDSPLCSLEDAIKLCSGLVSIDEDQKINLVWDKIPWCEWDKLHLILPKLYSFLMQCNKTSAATPFWLQLLHTCLKFNAFEECLKAGELWLRWHDALDQSNFHNWKFLIHLGMIQIALNKLEGWDLLERAYNWTFDKSSGFAKRFVKN